MKTFILGAMLLASSSSIAFAQTAEDAGAPAADSGIDISGFADVSVKNDYVSPRGLVVTSRGTTVQIADGVNIGLANGVTFTAGTWVDLNPGYKAPNTNSVNEFDYFFGVSGTVADRVKLGVQYVQFISGQNLYPDAKNIEFTVGYIDGAKGARFTMNPYAKLFWNVDGGSTVAVGKVGNTYDVEIGATPTVSLPGLTIMAPTWFTLAPKSYFGPINDGNLGVISTGLKVVKPLNLDLGGGKVALYATGQYYHLANDNLVLAKAILNQGDHNRNHFQFGLGVNIGF